MKSILFEVTNENIQNDNNTDPITKNEYPFKIRMKLPLLPAYSIEYLSVNVDGSSSPNSKEDEIIGGELILSSQYLILEAENAQVSVIVYYHGIRDYSLLFPWIDNIDLRERVGYYHEEADKNFDSGSWLSFTVMCGAIFEGVLNAKSITGKDFYKKIENAHSLKMIDENQKKTFHLVREFRNAVHSNLYKNPLINRKNAMDIKNTLNAVIKSFC